MTIDTTSPLGYGLLATYCTVTLPMPDGSTQTTTTVQPTLGIGVHHKTGAVFPSTSAGKQLFAGALQCRLSTVRGGLIDHNIPTTLGTYGVMVPDYLNADMTATEAGIVSSIINAQVRLDERTISSNVNGSLVDSTLILPINVVTAEGPVKLTLAIDVISSDLSVLSSP